MSEGQTTTKRGVQRRAEANPVRALSAFAEAAARYEELGRPLDRARCLDRMSDVMPEHAPRYPG